jgi:hypothetical protein
MYRCCKPCFRLPVFLVSNTSIDSTRSCRTWRVVTKMVFYDLDHMMKKNPALLDIFHGPSYAYIRLNGMTMSCDMSRTMIRCAINVTGVQLLSVQPGNSDVCDVALLRSTWRMRHVTWQCKPTDDVWQCKATDDVGRKPTDDVWRRQLVYTVSVTSRHQKWKQKWKVEGQQWNMPERDTNTFTSLLYNNLGFPI